MMSDMSPPTLIREVLEARPILEVSGDYTYIADVEVLHWSDHRMPLDLGVVLRDDELAIVVKDRRSYYWSTAWELEDGESIEEEDTPED